MFKIMQVTSVMILVETVVTEQPGNIPPVNLWWLMLSFRLVHLKID